MIYVAFLSLVTGDLPNLSDFSFHPLFRLHGNEIPLFSKTMKIDQTTMQCLQWSPIFVAAEEIPSKFLTTTDR